MRMRSWLSGFVVLGSVAVGSPAQAQSTDKPADKPAAADKLPDGVTQDMIDKGKTIFGGSGLCYACHGAKAEGVVGPSLVSGAWLHSKGAYTELVKQVTAGVPAEETKLGKGPMPPKGGSSISEDDVKAVAAYVWSISRKKTAPAT